MTSFLGVPVDAAYHLVSGLAAMLSPVLGGLAATAGIVLFTIAVRALLMPLSFRSLRATAVQMRLAPQVQALRGKYGKQPERLQRELTALYRKDGTSMFASLTPLLLQWPVFSVMYLMFRSPTVAGHPNLLLVSKLLGVPLGSRWRDGAAVLTGHGLTAPGAVFAGVLALLAVACWQLARQARAMVPAPAPASARASASASGSGLAAGGVGMTAGSVVTKALPYLTVLIAAFTPLAAAVYLVTSTGWSALERYLFRRGGVARGSSA